MGLNNLKLSVPTAKKPTDPLEIFNKLTLRGSIENIWEPQADALREWNKVRTKSDVVIQMNTGGGKTLVGMMIAQSLVNELNRRVLYVVPNNQLVEQTLSKATELGINPAARFKGQWHSQEAFQSAETFCITNYASVFTGHSTFFDKGVASLIFDDAHVAEGTIRDQFTIRVNAGTELFKKVVALYRPHFSNTIGASKLQDITNGNEHSILFVPMYITWKHSQELRTLLIESGIADDKSLLFPWFYLADHLNHCCVIISGSGIEICPPATPLHSLPYFNAEVRRIYLTATLPSNASFARAFGLLAPTIIRPSGKSGDAQRLFVFAKGENDEAQRQWSLKFTEKNKACVLSPSTKKAEQWSPPAVIFGKDNGHELITKFSAAKKPVLLGLVARYDGIDLPGDACRVLILDRLPKGEALFDKFIDEGIRIDAIRLGQTATRIVQAIGRIFRSNTDHGAAVLSGTDLQDWLRNPANRAFLPDLLQQQISLALELTKKVATDEITWEELLNGVLKGDKDWDKFYNEHVGQFNISTRNNADEWYPPLIVAERRGYAALWDGNNTEAITLLHQLSNHTTQHDRRLSAWYKHLEGVAHLCAGDQATALQAFTSASTQRVELGRPSEQRDKMFKPPSVESIGFQARNLATNFRTKKVNMLSAIDKVLLDLVYSNKTNLAEEAMRVLGELLGLTSIRPDKSEGTGPDNVWSADNDLVAWGFDLKTGKAENSEYNKEELAQAHDHWNWLVKKKRTNNVHISLVGRDLNVSNLANPDPELDIINLSGFQDVASNVKKMLHSVDAGDKSNLEDSFEGWLRHYGLIWPNCVMALPNKRALELKSD